MYYGFVCWPSDEKKCQNLTSYQVKIIILDLSLENTCLDITQLLCVKVWCTYDTLKTL